MPGILFPVLIFASQVAAAGPAHAPPHRPTPAPFVLTGESCRSGIDDKNPYGPQSAPAGVTFLFTRMPDEARVNPKLLEIVHKVAEAMNQIQHFAQSYTIISGYRDCATNLWAEHSAGLRGVTNPTHIRGEAIDIVSWNPQGDAPKFIKAGVSRTLFNLCNHHVHMDTNYPAGSGAECVPTTQFQRPQPPLRPVAPTRRPAPRPAPTRSR